MSYGTLMGTVGSQTSSTNGHSSVVRGTWPITKLKSHRDQKRFGQKCGHLCPNLLIFELKIQSTKKVKRQMDIGNPKKRKLHVMGGRYTIFLPTTMRNLTPSFRTPERSWTFKRSQRCHVSHENASLPRHSCMADDEHSRLSETPETSWTLMWNQAMPCVEPPRIPTAKAPTQKVAVSTGCWRSILGMERRATLSEKTGR